MLAFMKKCLPFGGRFGFMKALALLLVWPLCALADENAADLSKLKKAGDTAWDEAKLLETAEARIQQYRTGPAAGLQRIPP